MTRLPSARIRISWLAAGAMAVALQAAGAQRPPDPPGLLRAPRLSLVGSVGRAAGAGNSYGDVALAAGLQVGRIEGRVRVGTLAHLGGCPAIHPTKCGAGDGTYVDGTLRLRFPGSRFGVGAWVLSAGAGTRAATDRWFLQAAFGRDVALGRRGLLRIELHARRHLDGDFRDTWGESLHQYGVRIGLGLWTAVDRL